MFQDRTAAVLFLLFIIVSIFRIVKWAQLDERSGEAKTTIVANFIGAVVYSGGVFLYLIFMKEDYSHEDVMPALGKALLIMLWIYISIAHLFFLWMYAEVKMWLYKMEKRKNHIQ